jgi:hypothetical protein
MPTCPPLPPTTTTTTTHTLILITRRRTGSCCIATWREGGCYETQRYWFVWDDTRLRRTGSDWSFSCLSLHSVGRLRVFGMALPQRRYLESLGPSMAVRRTMELFHDMCCLCRVCLVVECVFTSRFHALGACANACAEAIVGLSCTAQLRTIILRLRSSR